jgi:hypothetical protein
VLESPTTRNIAIFSVAAVCQIIRLHREEAFLSRDPAYAVYQAAVRYRLLPRVY